MGVGLGVRLGSGVNVIAEVGEMVLEGEGVCVLVRIGEVVSSSEGELGSICWHAPRRMLIASNPIKKLLMTR